MTSAVAHAAGRERRSPHERARWPACASLLRVISTVLTTSSEGIALQDFVDSLRSLLTGIGHAGPSQVRQRQSVVLGRLPLAVPGRVVRAIAVRLGAEDHFIAARPA